MTNLPVAVVAGAAAVGCAVAGGVFFAFSSFVMPGLARLAAPQAIQAMQQINVTAVTPPFMLVLFGAGLAAGAATVVAFATGSAGASWILGGTVAYVVGVLGLTIGVHVPLNDALAVTGPDASAQWAGYLQSWVPWNHVRALAGVAAAAALVVGVTR